MTRILVVEDEPGIALGLEDDLKLEGYDVEVIGDGAAASQRAREGAFDLILLDVMLPGKDGFEICRELRRAGMRVPILMLTAKTQEAEKVMGLRAGRRRLRHQALRHARAAGAHQGAAAAGRRRAGSRSGVLPLRRRGSGFPPRRTAAPRGTGGADAHRIQAARRCSCARPAG